MTVREKSILYKKKQFVEKESETVRVMIKRRGEFSKIFLDHSIREKFRRFCFL